MFPAPKYFKWTIQQPKKAYENLPKQSELHVNYSNDQLKKCHSGYDPCALSAAAGQIQKCVQKHAIQTSHMASEVCLTPT